MERVVKSIIKEIFFEHRDLIFHIFEDIGAIHIIESEKNTGGFSKVKTIPRSPGFPTFVDVVRSIKREARD